MIYHVISRENYKCPWCDKARDLLSSKGLLYSDWKLSTSELKMMSTVLGFTTIPQIFYDGKRIGGYDDLVKHLEEE